MLGQGDEISNNGPIQSHALQGVAIEIESATSIRSQQTEKRATTIRAELKATSDSMADHREQRSNRQPTFTARKKRKPSERTEERPSHTSRPKHRSRIDSSAHNVVSTSDSVGRLHRKRRQILRPKGARIEPTKSLRFKATNLSTPASRADKSGQLKSPVPSARGIASARTAPQWLAASDTRLTIPESAETNQSKGESGGGLGLGL